MVEQRQIVEVPFNLPQGVLNHPALVISNNTAIELEEAFIAVMITSQRFDDEFTFELSSGMLESGKLDKLYSEIRSHLISFFRVSDVIRNSQRAKIKKADFARIITHIVRVTIQPTE